MSRTIQTLTLAQIGTLLDWAAHEGWNPGLNDAVAFQAADPQGFLGAFVDGVMVAGISAVAYDENFGFIGLYICHPDWRGQGHGRAVWDAALTYLGTRTIGLDAVIEQRDSYESMGFVTSYETVRMSGQLTALNSHQAAATLPAVRDLDRRCFPAPRDGFLNAWLAAGHAVARLDGNGHADAYAVIRPCRSGSKVGPLFARDVEAALGLLATLTGDVQIDVPAMQVAWLAGLEKLGFAAGFRTWRMYRGEPPVVSAAEVFGITSLELG